MHALRQAARGAMTDLITARNVCVSRRRREILRDVSLRIGAGDFVTIIGPNGAGKTMLIKCLIGFYKPDSGSVAARAGLRAGYVPQRLAPNPLMPITARRFLALANGGDADAVRAAAAETEITDALDKPLHDLSGGQLQRALLARALLNRPHLLVLDEPAQQLDVSGQLLFYQLLQRVYQARDCAILMVSHDLHFVMRSTKHVVCLFRHVCCSGKPRDVTRAPEFLDLFGEEMGRMMTYYPHLHDHAHDDGAARDD